MQRLCAEAIVPSVCWRTSSLQHCKGWDHAIDVQRGIGLEPALFVRNINA
jgi:hypothetical protein